MIQIKKHHIGYMHNGLFRIFAKRYKYLSKDGFVKCLCDNIYLESTGMHKYHIGNRKYWGGGFKCHRCKAYIILRSISIYEKKIRRCLNENNY